MDFKI